MLPQGPDARSARSQSTAEINIALEELKEETESIAFMNMARTTGNLALRRPWVALGGAVLVLFAAQFNEKYAPQRVTVKRCY